MRGSIFMKRIELSGKVFSGKSEGKTFLELAWVRRQIKEKVGFIPYPGTLNIRLLEESGKHRKFLDKVRSIEVCAANGYCNGRLYRVLIENLECMILIPEIAGYPKDVVEIISDINLREAFNLEDGDDVTVSIIF